MTREWKSVLKKAIDGKEGLISPASMINSHANSKQEIVQRLVTLGYLEMVPEETNGRAINFYRVTENGFSVFYPLHKKFWHHHKSDIRNILVSSITAIVVTMVTLLLK